MNHRHPYLPHGGNNGRAFQSHFVLVRESTQINVR